MVQQEFTHKRNDNGFKIGENTREMAVQYPQQWQARTQKGSRTIDNKKG
jgi:hypothetical protein